jgi:hypothetical protein
MSRLGLVLGQDRFGLFERGDLVTYQLQPRGERLLLVAASRERFTDPGQGICRVSLVAADRPGHSNSMARQSVIRATFRGCVALQPRLFAVTRLATRRWLITESMDHAFSCRIDRS